jgi:hypothetical protein
MTQSEFDKQWITAIAGRGADKFLMEWEAEAAIRELKRKKQLEAVCGEPTRAEIFREVQNYERYRDVITLANRMFRETDSLLRQTGRQLIAREKVLWRQLPFPALKPIASCVAEAAFHVVSQKHALHWAIKEFWRHALARDPYCDGYLYPYILDPDAPETPPITLDWSALPKKVEPLIEIGENPATAFFLDLGGSASKDPFPDIQQMNKKLNLDRHFQVRVAHILHNNARKLTKTTIARLIVLTYICARLSEYDEKHGLRIKGNRRALTPDAVYQKIKGMNFVEAAGRVGS